MAKRSNIPEFDLSRSRAATRFLIRFTVSREVQEEYWEVCRDIERLGGIVVSDGFQFFSRNRRDHALDVIAERWGQCPVEVVDFCEDFRSKVLFATSSQHDMQRYERFFRNCEIDMKPAYDGVNCLEAIHTHRPQVLILDENLLWGGSAGVIAILREEWDDVAVSIVLLQRNPSHQTPQSHPVIATFPISATPETVLQLIEQEILDDCPEDPNR